MKTGKKSISFLLGAGFSAPKGYPIGKKLNEELLNFDDSYLDFSPDGYLATSNDGTKPKFQIDGVQNIHQKHFEFCKRLINEYSKAHGGKFDYEEFYDFIKIYCDQYEPWKCRGEKLKYPNLDIFVICVFVLFSFIAIRVFTLSKKTT